MIDDTGPAAKTAKPLANKSSAAFRTIGEVAEELGVAQHVLRFWETRFPQVQPLKRGGNRRYYRPGDVELLRDIHRKLHAEGYTIKGVQKLLSERGSKIAPSSAAFSELNLGSDEHSACRVPVVALHPPVGPLAVRAVEPDREDRAVAGQQLGELRDDVIA